MSYRTEQFSVRLSHLRMEKGVSAREMSLDLGQNESYINRNENGKSLPSLTQFFNICDYLNITPGDFFDDGKQNMQTMIPLLHEAEKLSPEMMMHFLEIMKWGNSKKH